MYTCYLLRGQRTKKGAHATYVGITNNEKRRLRQHNGDLKGGARHTRAYRPWTPYVHVRNFSSKSAALKFEHAVKHKRRTRKGATPLACRVLTMLKHLVTQKEPLHVHFFCSRAQVEHLMCDTHSVCHTFTFQEEKST